MFIFIFATILLTAFFTAEGIVASIISTAASYGLTQFLKGKIGLQGFGAALLAFVIALVVGLVAYVVTTFLNGEQITVDTIVRNAAQIFTLATLAYQLLGKNESGLATFFQR